MLAAANGDVEITRMLLKAGAKTGYKYVSSGATAASLAGQRGHTNIIELLQRRLTDK
jgi:ankyrin repeat protein